MSPIRWNRNLLQVNTQAVLSCLLLLLIANGTPVITLALLGNRYARPLDNGRRWRDGRFLFGPTKTIRGVVAAVIAAAIAGLALGLPFTTGAVLGLYAMLGDLGSSFTKRRLGFNSSHSVPVLDQLPESLVPVLGVKGRLALTGPDIFVIVAGFFFLELLLSKLLDRLQRHDHPMR